MRHALGARHGTTDRTQPFRQPLADGTDVYWPRFGAGHSGVGFHGRAMAFSFDYPVNDGQ